MNFNSINKIKEHFGLEIEDVKELRKELRNKLAKVHPDKTGGKFAGNAQQRDHDEITAAIDFIDNESTDIILSNKNLVELIKKVDELSLLKEKEEIKVKEQYNQLLENHIDSSVIRYQKKHTSLKISSLVAITLISSIWAFPSIVLEHPVLKNIFVLDSIPFTVAWICSIVFAGYIWLYSKSIEKEDKLIKLNYNIDTTQNTIFKFFLAWTRAAKHSVFDFDSKTYKFSRDDLFNFILNHYQGMNEEFGEYYELDDWELYRKISEKYENKKDLLIIRDKSSLKKRFLNFFTQPGEIDVDLAHKLTDTMLQKLKLRNIIILDKKLAFHDTYKYTLDTD